MCSGRGWWVGWGGNPNMEQSRLWDFAWLSFCLPFSVHCLVSAFCPKFSLSTGQRPPAFWAISRALVVSCGSCNHHFTSNHDRQHRQFSLSLCKRENILTHHWFAGYSLHANATSFLWRPPCIISYLFLTFMKSRHFQRIAFVGNF